MKKLKSIIKWPFILIAIIVLGSCQKANQPLTFSFYHWKSNAIHTDLIQENLKLTNTKELYLHYFDVVDVINEASGTYQAFPGYVLRDVSHSYKHLEIIPVIYIKNNALRITDNMQDLNVLIVRLVNQMSEYHFKKKWRKIQIDCDWNEATRIKYFDLLKMLNTHFEVSATIRLHQIKFPDKTGIPPVKNGTLMLYNVGDLFDEQSNSILETDLVNQYIDEQTEYPIDLSVALPLFSQTVIKNNQGNIRIISGNKRELFANDSSHFTLLSENLFEVCNDTTLAGYYLSKGNRIKCEIVSAETISAAYHLVKKSELKTNKIIFYHLENSSNTANKLEQVMQAL